MNWWRQGAENHSKDTLYPLPKDPLPARYRRQLSLQDPANNYVNCIAITSFTRVV